MKSIITFILILIFPFASTFAQEVANLDQLMKAIDAHSKEIVITSSISIPYSISLPEGITLKGIDQNKSMLLFGNSDGIGLKGSNTIENLTILVNPLNRAIYNESLQENFGTYTLANLSVTGQVQFVIRSQTVKGNIVANNVDIVNADARRYSEQPQKYGVNVYQGAFTIYNYNSDSNSIIHATLEDISIGRKNAPVAGSGLFISGFGDNGGRVIADKVTTLDIHSSGFLPEGTPNMITGGVFVVYGAEVKKLLNKGTVTTYGVNDMVLDAWGRIDEWIAEKPITSFGPSGIGFVNFGKVGKFIAHEKITTYGAGARGFNQYDGTVDYIQFHSIETFGDGSVGIQVARPIKTMIVDHDIITHGGIGNTLVKGVIVKLPAYAFSLKEGGSIENTDIKGDIVTSGEGVCSIIIESDINNFRIEGRVKAQGKGSIKFKATDGIKIPESLINIK